MKIHARKKAYKRDCKAKAKEGLINTHDGKWERRSNVTDNSMQKDYYPQTLRR